MTNPLKKFARKLRAFLLEPLLDDYGRRTDISQVQLAQWYRYLHRSGAALPSLRDAGFKVHSEADEDGILLYLFSILGCTDRRAVELCAGNGRDGNTANLIINHGWHALLIDGNPTRVEQGRSFFANHPHTRFFPPVFVQAWVTRETINSLVENQGFSGAIDLLSLDMDGMDYWIWEALQVIEPRVVVLEFQDILGPEKSVTVPYTEDFNAYEWSASRGMPNYCGASLTAFTRLAKRKGYRLVGCNRYGYNAFFVKAGLGEKEFPEIPVAECFLSPKYHAEAEQRLRLVEGMPWVEV